MGIFYLVCPKIQDSQQASRCNICTFFCSNRLVHLENVLYQCEEQFLIRLSRCQWKASLRTRGSGLLCSILFAHLVSFNCHGKELVGQGWGRGSDFFWKNILHWDSQPFLFCFGSISSFNRWSVCCRCPTQRTEKYLRRRNANYPDLIITLCMYVFNYHTISCMYMLCINNNLYLKAHDGLQRSLGIWKNVVSTG